MQRKWRLPPTPGLHRGGDESPGPYLPRRNKRAIPLWQVPERLQRIQILIYIEDFNIGIERYRLHICKSSSCLSFGLVVLSAQ